jgi:hypothetical protein
MIVSSGKTLLDTDHVTSLNKLSFRQLWSLGLNVADLARKFDNRFRSPFGSVTQTSDPVMGRFDLGELVGNKLLS